MDGIVAAIQGRAGSDADPKYTQGGKFMVTFSVGVVVGKPPHEGERAPMEWVRVTCWDEVAEKMQARIVKGVEVYCEGKLTLGRWEGADGSPRSGLNLSAWTVQPVGQIGRRVPQEARQGASRETNGRAAERTMASAVAAEDNDAIPF